MTFVKGYVQSEENRKKISDAMKGRVSNNKGKLMSIDQREKISKSLQGHQVSEESRKKMSESHIGKPSYNKGKGKLKEKKEIYIKTKEHRKKLSDASKKQWENSETREKMCAALREVNQKPWSEERRRKQSERLKKNPVNHWLGKKRPPQSEEMKRKWRETRSKLPKEKLQEIKKKISDAGKERCGEKSHMWQGGISFDPYCYKFNKKRKQTVCDFFNYLCLCCGKHVTENIIRWGNMYKQKELSVHHIDHDKEQGCNGKPFNLIPMCTSCHSKEIYKEQEFKNYINKTLTDGFKYGIWNEQEYLEKVMY